MTDQTFVGLASTRARRDPIRAIVLHHTGGQGGLDQLFRTLRTRTGPRSKDGLSVHYGVAPNGEMREWAPPELVCLHAGPANEWSIGFEVCSPGFPGKVRNQEKAKGIERVEYQDRLNGRRVKFVDYTVEQYAALLPKIDALCAKYDIPRKVPTEADGSLMKRVMTNRELGMFRGVMAHYHITDGKADPGTQPLIRLMERWR